MKISPQKIPKPQLPQLGLLKVFSRRLLIGFRVIKKIQVKKF